MEGKLQEAKKQYELAATLARKAGFVEGSTNAKAGLRRIMEVAKGKGG